LCFAAEGLQRQQRARFTRRWRGGKTHAVMHPHRCRRAHSGRGYPQGHPRRPRPGWRRDRRHRLLRCRACPLLAGRGDKGLVGESSRSAVNLVLGSEPRSGIALQSLLDWCSRTCASQLVAGAGIKAKSSPQGRNVVLFSVTAWDAEGWFAHSKYGSCDQLINTAVRVPVFLNRTLLL
jgi:hypothetical protein